MGPFKTNLHSTVCKMYCIMKFIIILHSLILLFLRHILNFKTVKANRRKANVKVRYM